MPSWVFYKPLAILLVALLTPALAWVANSNLFLANAQVGSGCFSGNNSIIQNYCDAAGNIYVTDLAQLEADSIDAYLDEHHIEKTAASRNIVYQYGRSDLRSQIRGIMFANLLSIVNMTPSARTTHQQALFTWFQSLVQKNEFAYYDQAVKQYGAWFNDACHFTLDPTIAQQYGLSYNGNPWCGASFSLAALFDPNLGVPSTSYFTTYGLKKSYAVIGDSFPGYGALVAQTNISTGQLIGVLSTAAGFIAALTAGGSIAAGLTPVITTVTVTNVFEITNALQGTLTVVESTTTTAIPATMVVVPVAIIAMAILIGISAGMNAFDYSRTLQEQADLVKKRNALVNTPPDIYAMAADTSGQGAYKLQNTFIPRTLAGVCNGGQGEAASVPCAGQTPRDLPSSATLPQHVNGTDWSFDGAEALQYRDWNGANWNVATWGGWFVQTCVDGLPQSNSDGSNATNGKCAQSDSIIADLFYIDWSDTTNPDNTRDRGMWSAVRIGDKFSLVKGVKTSAKTACTASEKGVTGGDLSQCSAYVSDSVKITGGNGSQLTMRLKPYTNPSFPAPYYMSFTAGTAGSKAIVANGNPVPTLSVESSTLPPSDFTITGGGTSTLTIQFTGMTPNLTQDYTLTVKGLGFGGVPLLQVYNIRVKSTLAITSPDRLDGMAGVPVDFLVTTTGPSPRTITIEHDVLGAGLTFTDNGNGTATISGAFDDIGNTEGCIIQTGPSTSRPCGLFVTAGAEQEFQRFRTNFTPAPAASFVDCCAITFYTNVLNQYDLVTRGAITPVSIFFFGQPPNWLSIEDKGNGSAILKGTPPSGAAGDLSVPIVPKALGQGVGLAQTFTLKVADKPILKSPYVTDIKVDVGIQPVTLNFNVGTATIDQQMPPGVTFTPGNPATISGTPQPGGGGQHDIKVIVNDGNGGASNASFKLNVFEGPKITSTPSATMFVGVPGSFVVTTTGYPNVSTHKLPPNPLPPTDPKKGDGMWFSWSGLPPGLQASFLSSNGFATGNLTIQGTPPAGSAGRYNVPITARNGQGNPATQTLVLDIVTITGAAPASSSTCNGNYNGTFKGNVVLSPGQNCSFFGGGITGNVSLNGGNLSLTNATINGNVGIQGGSSFSIGQGTTINGNLNITNVGSGSTSSQVCGTKVTGNATIDSNAIPMMIGSPVNFCFTNVFSNNLNITNNTGAITVNENDVDKNLNCSGNTAITGSGNAAEKKQGQCSGF
jgi:hypothetical protein